MNSKKIAKIGMIAGLYAAITMALGVISYGPIQFRLSEVMTLLPLIGKEYILGLTIGCFVANLASGYGLVDIVFGTLATLISVYLVYKTGQRIKDNNKRVLIASLWPTIINALIIGSIVLHYFFGLPLMLSILQVGFGQFVVITIIGVPLFIKLQDKLKKFL